jgi:hypothetical protein
MNRPIPKNLLKVAIKEVVHLLQLRHMLTEKMMGEYIAGVDVYLAQVREASKEDVKKYQVEIINIIFWYRPIHPDNLVFLNQNKVIFYYTT